MGRNFLKDLSIFAPCGIWYVRYGKTEGNFALSKPRTPEENIIRLTAEGIKVGEHKLEIHVTNGDDLT